eukprot:3940745-Rhodomonas_salina.2
MLLPGPKASLEITVSFPICLQDCYAMSGTDLASAAICLRTCYAMSSTDLAYAAIPYNHAMRCPEPT